MKSLFTLALVTLGTLFGQTQVYTSNVVGYINDVWTNGYSFAVNQLGQTNNGLVYIVPDMPEGSKVFVWDVTNQVYEPPSIFTSGTWSINYDLPPGRGFIVHATSIWTNTFVGEVLQGQLTNYVAGFNQFTLLGSKVPQTGQLSADLGFPLLEGCDVHLFHPIRQEFSHAYTCFTNHGWFDPTGVTNSGGPPVNVAEAFLVQNPGPPTNWVRTFVIDFAASPAEASSPSEQSAPPLIEQISLAGNKVTLRVRNQVSKRYNVQFSTDRVSWTTIARDQSRAVWSRDLPYSHEGYFKLGTP